MSDDIDIEEHDILDNPHIRNIFPDLSVVKKEISEYFNEALPVKQLIKQEPELSELNSPQLGLGNKASINYDETHNTIEDKNVQEHSNSPTNSVKKLYTNISFQKNKIIIGSKPNKSILENESDTRTKNQIRYPKVSLHDVRTNLEKSERYCRECKILFSEKSKFTEHYMTKHSTAKRQILTRTRINTKNNVDKNFMPHIRLKELDENNLKSVTKLDISKNIAEENDKSLKRMDTSTELNENIKPLTRSGSPKNKTNENVKPSTSSNTSSSEEDSDVEMPLAELNSSDSSDDETVVESVTKREVPRCRICDIRVANRGNLVRHYRAIHRKKLTFISAKTTDKSKRNSSDKLSSPKSNRVSKVKSNKTEKARDSSFCCRICNIKFSSVYSLNRHMNSNVHRSNINSSPLKNKIGQRLKANELITKNTKIENSDAELKKCFHCDQQFSNSKSLIEHVYQVLNPKRTRNSYRIEDHLEAKTEPNNKKDLRPTNIKTNKNALYSNKIHLEVRNEKSIKNKVRSIKNKTTDNAIKSHKKQFESRYEITDKRHLRPTKDKINNDALKSDGKENNTKDLLFVCQHCTCCFLTIKNYIKHMINRHGTKVSKINRQPFDPQCKYCSSKNPSVLYHNRHLYKEHLDILEKKITSNNYSIPESGDSVNDNMQNAKSFAFKSAMFKCGRCDIHFISSETAKDHTGHMEFLINWKCSICDLIFKKTDENMHLLQHLSSEYIAVHEFSSEALSSLLYNCTKCAIHFSEKNYLDHYEKCEKETAISSYCKACDILINEDDANTHTINHNQNENFSLKVITSDIIFDNKLNHVKSDTKNETKVKKPIAKYDKLPETYNILNVTLTCCPTCQCFMTVVRKIHLKKKCTKMIKRICVECGLLLTGKSIDTHRKHHKMKDLTLQDYIFTDLSGNITKPPIPEFPQCKICKVYFVNKLGINGHVCSEFTDITSCDICKIKLSNTAFKLHMAYHNYCLKNEKVTTNNKTPTPPPPPLPSVKKQKVVSKVVRATKNTTATSTTGPNENSSIQDLNETRNSITKIDPNIAILFTCKSCFITLNTYDKLIEHCQNHPTAEEAQSLNLKSCNVCNLKFDFSTYEIHNEIHTNKLTIKNLTVDIQHFVFDKKIWVNNVFNTLNPNQINEIIGKSIYQSEHRVKLKLLQNGPHNLTIYKCARCSLFFDHENVFRHAKCKNVNVRGTPCASCGLKFLSGALRNQHLKIHFDYPKIDEKSYRIILFNNASDEVHSNIASQSSQYILYQCRNCNGVIEKSANHQCSINDLKKCYKCGLLIYKEKFKNHTLEHNSLTNFEPDNIKVILLGAKEAKTDKEISIPHPSFKGLIYDYTLYQCKRCEICVKNDLYISNHVCVFGIYRCQCLKCDFFFNSKGYNHHLKTHNVDPDFKKENMNIVQFDFKSNTGVKQKATNVKELEHKVKVEPTNKVTVVLYKCKCGLHFVDRCKVIKHIKQCNPKIKSYKQNCTKCSLLFNPSELFSHLVNHHGNKNQPIKYDVKEISDENVKEFEKVILFNCSKCGLHYLDKIVASDHYKLCNGDIGDFEECTKCKIIYDKSSFVLNEHNENCENKFEIEIIDENNTEITADTANVDLSQTCENITNEH